MLISIFFAKINFILDQKLGGFWLSLRVWVRAWILGVVGLEVGETIKI